MSLSKLERMKLFLQKNYYTLSEIAKVCSITEVEVLSLEAVNRFNLNINIKYNTDYLLAV